MKRSNPQPVSRKAERGFSVTELVVTVAIGLVLMAIALPAFMKAYRSYQLTGAASQMADILRLTRYEAIRRNTWENCVIGPSTTDAGMTVVFADADNNSLQNGSEKMILLGAAGNLVDAGSLPGSATANLSTAAIGGAAVVTPSPTGSSVRFDARGAVVPAGGNVPVTVFYLSGSNPDAGYRAVILMPAGSIQIWSGDAAGNWQQLR